MLGAVNWVPRWYRHGGTWSTEQLAGAMSEMLDRAVSVQPSRVLLQDVGCEPLFTSPSAREGIIGKHRVCERP